MSDDLIKGQMILDGMTVRMLRSRIEQLERELVREKWQFDRLKSEFIEKRDQLAAEKALADELYEGGITSNHFGFPCYKAYRKARGM